MIAALVYVRAAKALDDHEGIIDGAVTPVMIEGADLRCLGCAYLAMFRAPLAFLVG